MFSSHSPDGASNSLRYLLSSFGFLSVALLAVTTVLVALDIPILWSIDQASAAPAITATIFNPFALLLIIATIVLSCSETSSNSLAALPMGAGALAILGICVSFATFMIKRAKAADIQKTHRSSLAFETELGCLLACAVAHVAFFTILVFIRRSASTSTPVPAIHVEKACSPTKESIARLSPLRILKRPAQTAAPAFGHQDSQMSSPIMCRNSWHVTYDEKEGKPRAMDSQDRLISTRNSADSGIGTSFEKDHSPACSTPTKNGEILDAIAVESRLREMLTQAPPTWPYGTRLETIPGSRPTSKYITDTGRDSFTSGDDSADEPQSAITIPDSELMSSPPQSSPVGSAPASPTRVTYTVPRTASRGSTTKRASRCTTPIAQESHIHPLFRSASPVPPPTASANTTITASPLSGHVIPVPARSLSRNRSRAPSPSLRRQTDAGLSTLSRSNSTASSTRSTVNVIPEFILTINQERMA